MQFYDSFRKRTTFAELEQFFQELHASQDRSLYRNLYVALVSVHFVNLSSFPNSTPRACCRSVDQHLVVGVSIDENSAQFQLLCQVTFPIVSCA